MKFDILKPISVSGSGRKAIQEDCMFPALGEGTIHDKLFIVCDGIGDDGKGYTASDYFCRKLPDFFFQNTCPDEPLDEQLLHEALTETCRKLQQRCPDADGLSFAMLYFHRQGCLAAHVGNARIYQIRPRNHTLLYKSADDERVFTPDADHVTLPVKECITDVEYGDYFLVMTKGVHQVLSDEQLVGMVCQPGNDTAKQTQLIKALSNCPDNYSLTMVHVSGVMREEGDELRATRSQAPRKINPVPLNRPAVTPDPEPIDKVRVNRPQHERDVPRTVGKPQATGQEQITVSKPQRTVEEDFDRRSPQKERNFPIVAVTAASIVAAGAFFWFVSQPSDNEDKEAAVVEVKKETNKRDTLNIMKNETPKPLKGLEEDKKKKEEEKTASQPEKKENTSPDTAVNVSPVVVDYPPVQPAEQKPVEEPATDTHPQRQESTTAPATTPTTTPTDPNSVTPRPVIPEGE